MRKKRQPIEIRLTNSNQVALIDEEDYLLVSPYTWRLKRSAYTPYVCTTKWVDGKAKTLRLHRLVMNPKSDEDVHHFNHDTCDNRKENLECRPMSEHRGRHPKNYM